jgi:predicted HTH transcriptional regulator
MKHTHMITEQRVLDDMRRNERQRVEFKRGLIKTGELAEQIMAFANAEGGTIYLGIADQPKPHSEPVFEEIGHTFRVTFYGPADRILDLIPEEGVTDLRALGLNERQIEALRLMVNEGHTFTNREYCQQFGVSVATATRDLGKLVEVGQATRLGQGRSTRYIAT